jgi:hypothetical protein
MAADPQQFPQNLLKALKEFAEAADRSQLRYALIGAVAAGYRSRPRFTQDLDFLLDVPQIVLPAFLEKLRNRGFTFATESAIREWTREHMTTLRFQNVAVDCLKPLLPCYQHILEGARVEVWLEQSIRIASPEGLIVSKLLAFRTQDQLDIENLLAANRGQLDLDSIRREYIAIMDPDDARLSWFEQAANRFYLPKDPES